MRRLSMLLVALSVAFGASFGVAMADPELTVTSPREGEAIDGMNVTIEFEASDFSIVPSTVPLEEAGQRPEANREGEGHVHIMLDLMPVIVWESSEPYVLANVPPGEHVLMVELVNNDHGPLSPSVSQQIRFRTNSDQLLSRTGDGQAVSNGLAVIVVMLVGAAIMSAGLVIRRKAA